MAGIVTTGLMLERALSLGLIMMRTAIMMKKVMASSFDTILVTLNERLYFCVLVPKDGPKAEKVPAVQTYVTLKLYPLGNGTTTKRGYQVNLGQGCVSSTSDSVKSSGKKLNSNNNNDNKTSDCSGQEHRPQ